MRRLLIRAALGLAAAAVGALTTVTPAHATPPDVAPVLAFMRAQVGKPYMWAANGPDSWDCSSLVQAAYRTIGVTLPRITTEQVDAGTRVALADVQPGDLLFTVGPPPQPGHVGMYVGAGQVIEAKGVRWGVVVTPLTAWTDVLATVRPDRSFTIADLITRAAAREGLPRALLHAQINQESGFNPRAGSTAGAQGIAQFLPGTWASVGVDGDGDGKKDVWDPADAIPAMAKHMAALIRANDGDVGRALAGYNAGQGAVEKYDGIPPYRETQNYVRSIEAASGVSGRIELPDPAPLPERVVQAAAREVVRTVTPPSLPDSPQDAVHDLAVGLLAVIAAAGLLARFAPQLQALVRRAATPPRRSGQVTAGYAARAVSAAAVRGGVRRVEGFRAARRPNRFHRTTFPSPQVSRRPEGWVAPSRPLRRPAPSPPRRGAVTGAPQPHRNHRNAARLRCLRWPFATAMRWRSRAATRRMRRVLTAATRWLRWPITAHLAAAADRTPGTANPAPTAPPTAPQPPQPAPQAVPAPRTPSAAEVRLPTPQRPPHPLPVPVPQGRGLVIQNRAPIDINPFDYLTDPGFARLLRVSDALEQLNYSSGETIVALVVYLDQLTTALAEGGDRSADEIAARKFDTNVVKEMREAAAKVGEAADHYRMAAKQLIDKHPDLFALRVSKDAGPIGYGTAVSA
ncbi:NlpC/P60 family protein [Protofrankia symbiont of Coriaria ruscifolia]|uniref:NlpC/P60 family protein n=1 Tax=Protofrankia symbiont of Coriaria ruscifolia TaxID=1306542 RepID=UPI003242450E